MRENNCGVRYFPLTQKIYLSTMHLRLRENNRDADRHLKPDAG